MTISSSTSKNQYTGNNVLVNFTYTFKIFDDDDIQVLLGEVVQTKITDYSVSGVGNDAGGTVTFVTAPGTGVTVTLKRNEPLTQEIDYVDGDDFPAASHEEGLDRSAIRDQFLEEQIGRAITLSEGSTFSGIIVPDPVADNLLGWNAAGTNLANIQVADISTSLDVLLTGLAANDYLQFDGTNWVNKTPTEVGDSLSLSGELSVSGTASSSASLSLAEDTDNGTNKVEIKAPAAVTADITFTLPDDDGDANEFLTSNGSGTLSFTYGVIDEDDMTSDSDTKVPTQQSVKAYVDASGITLGTAVAASGSAVDFTGIPAGTKQIIALGLGVNPSASNDILIQLGDSGGVETTGYISTASTISGGTTTSPTSTSGFLFPAAGSTVDFTLVIDLQDSTDNTWHAHGGGQRTGGIKLESFGDKALSGELDRVRITLTAGTFDGGELNVNYVG